MTNTELNYMEMANKISIMLENKLISEDNKKEPEAKSVNDVLTDLIHMDNPADANQAGGVAIETLVENMIGGNSKGNNPNLRMGGNSPNSQVNNKQVNNSQENIEFITNKPTNENLFEGGYLSNSETESDYSESEYDYIDQLEQNNINIYEEFLKHINDKEIEQHVMTGGNAEHKEKIQIISKFPYLLRY